MFSTTGLFENVICPEGPQCGLSFCIFNHPIPATQPATSITRTPQERGTASIDQVIAERPLKKQRVDTVSSVTTAKTFGLGSSAIESFDNKSKPKNEEQKGSVTAAGNISPPPSKKTKLGSTSSSSLPRSQIPLPPKPQAPVKPLEAEVAVPKPKKPPKNEGLLPRLLPRPPAQHNVRLSFIKLIHAELVRLNREIKASDDPDKKPLILSEQELITESLNEEEKIAKENSSVYGNVIKHRIMTLKKMKIPEWRQQRLLHIARDNPRLLKPSPQLENERVKSDLTPEEEVSLLLTLLTPVDGLAEYGYIANPPTAQETERASEGVKVAKGWERCDRCDTRFQVFPGRREDGVLTTNGPCVHHWGKKTAPQRQPGMTGLQEHRWTCCNEALGTKGCTKTESHVFKVSSAPRLASILPFEETTKKGPNPPKTAVAFDCEMGYTSLGLELIRLTATDWPSGDELLDVLVRPLGEVIDLNSRFSGVFPEDFTNALPYNDSLSDRTSHAGQKRKTNGDDTTHPNESSNPADRKLNISISGSSPANSPTASKPNLRIVSSPSHARALLFAHLTPITPLIGHAIDNDLIAARICHPRAIVDTCLLFPHPTGLPRRYGLKALAKKHLGWEMQRGDGSTGHDSLEDARATGELVRFKVAQKWKEMRREGWRVESGVFIPPEGG